MTASPESMINTLVSPETELEHAIVRDQAWINGAMWGKPRFGHPEGKVILHIREVLDNVDKATDEPLMRQQLRLITLIHDSFKYLEDRSYPRKVSMHHAAIAYRFAREYVQDKAVLDTILLHDHAYYAWVNHNHGRDDLAERFMRQVYDRLGPNMQLYYLFFKCDTKTGDKTQLPLQWFEDTAQGIERVDF